MENKKVLTALAGGVSVVLKCAECDLQKLPVDTKEYYIKQGEIDGIKLCQSLVSTAQAVTGASTEQK